MSAGPWYSVIRGGRKEVALMRGTKRTAMMPDRMRRLATRGKQEMMLRRVANHNVHVITPHGKILAGRKGRKG